jgi:tetratricopeptide (TPR) repeat protein/HEAT repeat protein
VVRRPLLLASFAACLAAASGARADWEVRRGGTEALVNQAARALGEQPDDDALARRLVKLAGKRDSDRLRAEFRARADGTPARYNAVEAYAQLLLALHAGDEAAVQFDRALALRPGDAAPLAGKARALVQAGKRPEAITAYDAAAQIERRPRERRRLLEAELALLGQPDDLERELAIRRELAALAPDSDAAAELLADALERAGRPQEAAAVLEARVPPARAGVRVDLALRAATLLDAGGDSTAAAARLADLLRRLPSSAADRRREVWNRAVEVARHRGALPALAGELARAPAAVEWEVLSQVRDELGDLEGALEAARRASSQARQSPELGRRIVALLERLGRDEEATAAYEALARSAPGEPRWAVELVEREFRKGRRKQAVEHFDRAATRFAGNPGALAQLAELASRWGEDRRSLAAWERVRRLDPRDELAILGLGEVQFQRGKKEAALRTWQALRDRERSPAAGHVRLGEVLLEHDLGVEALAEVQRAQTLEPKQPRPHRLMAQILERQHKVDAAVHEWETVLAMNAGRGHAAERHEARARILALLAHDGRGRLEERIRRLEEDVRRNPEDREAALFLAEAQQRDENLNAAITTLRGIVERDAAAPARDTTPAGDGRPEDAGADAVLALVRLLRHTGQVDEAVRRLEDLGKRVPGRARDAYVQIADIALSRYDEDGALAHAERAARLAPGDGQALARIAEIEERAGDDGRALATYRQAFGRDANPTAAFALARLLERHGAAREASDVLREVLRGATDDEVITEAGRRAIEVDEYLGRLPELEQLVSGAIFSGQKGPAYRRVLVEVLRRLLPPLYRASATDPAAMEARARIAQHGLRPLLELVTDGDTDPDRTLIDLLGMLGNKDASPVLAHLAENPTPHADQARPSVPVATEPQLAAVVALGRLGDERGRDVLERLAVAPDAMLRAAAVWALGRIPGPRSAAPLSRALQDPRTDVAALACLGVGRQRDAQAVALLATIASDTSRPLRLRRAAIAGLGLAGDRAATPALLALADSGDDDLGRAAAVALGTLRDGRALSPLLARALVSPRARSGEGGPAVAALQVWAAARSQPTDEATAIDGPRIDVEALLAALSAPPQPADLARLWLDRTRELREALGQALNRGGATRQRALEALDSRNDGPGLSPLVPEGAGPLGPGVAAGVRDVVMGLRDRLATLMDDADLDTQAMALRVLVKMGDERVTTARVTLAAAGRTQALRDAAAFAARWQAHASPRTAPALAQALVRVLATSPAWESRLSVVTALGGLGDAGAGGLERALEDDNPLVRAAAASELASQEGATGALAAAAGDPVVAVRAAVARSLARHRGPAARAALQRLGRDESARVRRATVADDDGSGGK